MRLAVVEDDKEYGLDLINQLERFGKEQGVDFNPQYFPNGAEFIEKYNHQFDAILLDVDMPVMNGIDTAKAIREVDKQVLLMFITNLSQYAIKGFEVDAIDYVLKPINYAAFSIKMKRLLRIYRSRSVKSIFIKIDSEKVKLPLMDIYYIEVKGHTFVYHCVERDYITTVGGSLSALARDLSDEGFSLCNSCYLINLFHVDSISSNSVKIAGDVLAISRGKKKKFSADFENYVSKGVF